MAEPLNALTATCFLCHLGSQLYFISQPPSCGHVTQFWPMACGCKKHHFRAWPTKISHVLTGVPTCQCNLT